MTLEDALDQDLDNLSGEPLEDEDNLQEDEPNEDTEEQDLPADDKEEEQPPEDLKEVSKEFLEKFFGEEKPDFSNPVINKLIKSAYNSEQLIGKRESEKDQEITQARQELDTYKNILEKTTGIQNPEQVEIYKAEQELNNAYFLREINTLRKYFDIPTDQQGMIDAYTSVMQDYKGHLAELDPINAAQLTSELLNIANLKKADIEGLGTKKAALVQKSNADAKQFLSQFIETDFKESPEIIRNESKSTIDLLANDLESLGVPLNQHYLKTCAEHFKERDSKIYQAGLEEGKKQAQIGAETETRKKSLNGGAGLTGDKQPGKKLSGDLTFDDYQKLSPEEKTKYLLK